MNKDINRLEKQLAELRTRVATLELEFSEKISSGFVRRPPNATPAGGDPGYAPPIPKHEEKPE